jgi:hypothetical protein
MKLLKLQRAVAALAAIVVATAGAVLVVASPAAAAGPYRFEQREVPVWDGAIRVTFYLDELSGNLMHYWTGSGGAYSLGRPAGVTLLGSPSPVRTPDGRLTVFIVALGTRNLWHKWQLCDECGWSGWHNLGGGLNSNPAAVYKRNQGVFVVFAQGLQSNDLWHIWQVCHQCNWSTWTNIPGGWFTSYPEAYLSGDRALVGMWHEDGKKYWNWQLNDYPGTWTGWGLTRPATW